MSKMRASLRAGAVKCHARQQRQHPAFRFSKAVCNARCALCFLLWECSLLDGRHKAIPANRARFWTDLLREGLRSFVDLCVRCYVDSIGPNTQLDTRRDPLFVIRLAADRYRTISSTWRLRSAEVRRPGSLLSKSESI